MYPWFWQTLDNVGTQIHLELKTDEKILTGHCYIKSRTFQTYVGGGTYNSLL